MSKYSRCCTCSLRSLPGWGIQVLIVLLLLPVSRLLDAQKIPLPPKTRTDNVKEVLHGVEVVDPYRWLEDRNSPETREWIKAQDEYAGSILGSLPNRDSLARRVAELLRIETIGIPQERMGRIFFTRRLPDQDLSSICMVRGTEGIAEVLVDPNTRNKDPRVSVTLLDVSRDGSLLAYGIRPGGQDEVEIHLLNVEKRTELPDRLPLARYHGVALSPDNGGIYYSKHNSQGPRVFFHLLGRDSDKDVELFGKEYGPDKIIIPDLSEDGRYLLLTVIYGSAGQRTEIYLQDLSSGGGAVPIVTGIPARFVGELGGEQLFLHTNWEAPRGRILAVDLKNPARQNWKEIIAAGSATIQGFSAAGGKLFVNYLGNVVSQVKMYTAAGKRQKELDLPGIGTIGGISGRWSSRIAFLSYTSFHIPPMVFRCETETGNLQLWRKPTSTIDPDRFVIRQVWYESKDKTRIPMFLLHSPGLALDGSTPTLLTGYGGFNHMMTPTFSATAVVWAESGGVYAVPNLRGGGEFGEDWHRAGMLEKKQNGFDDFIAAAEWLIKKGYTKPSRLAIAGRSNGGLLVGAALTQRPDLFEAVICGYPLLDMVRYHKFLVAPFWIPEYGSAESPEQLKYLLAYSPYHHVKAGVRYPAVLFISGDSDTRVDPLHARKMTALLQAASASGKPVILRYDTRSGHVSDARPVSKIIRDSTDELSFLFWCLGERFQ